MKMTLPPSAKAARLAGVPRVVLASSIYAVRGAGPSPPIAPSTPGRSLLISSRRPSSSSTLADWRQRAQRALLLHEFLGASRPRRAPPRLMKHRLLLLYEFLGAQWHGGAH